jgi:hypothetical protein
VISLYRSKQTIAVAYLARGADRNWFVSFERFLNSYRLNPSGVQHSLYVIFKGFENNADLERAKFLFSRVPHKQVFTGDENLDIGAYIEWANMIEEDLICVFNTASEILSPDWLLKLSVNLAQPNTGLVGATASYESLKEWHRGFPAFPNIHIRSTGFMINRKLFLNITQGLEIIRKEDAFNFESGARSLTRQVLANGSGVLLVGRNGRGYPPEFWAASDTFRLARQKNLLIADNQTRNFSVLPYTAKMDTVKRTWGQFIRGDQWLPNE